MKQPWKINWKNNRNGTVRNPVEMIKNAGGILLPAVFVVFGAVFVYLGVSRGEMGVVLRKAINICLECIGIG